MRGPSERTLIFTYIYLAISCAILGTGITFVVIWVCAYYGIDIFKNMWVLAIPVFSAVALNVIFLELWRKFRRG